MIVSQFVVVAKYRGHFPIQKQKTEKNREEKRKKKKKIESSTANKRRAESLLNRLIITRFII